ncbi:MAG: glycine--tRNA ligase subunit beta [Desulfobulbaceae bacterium]|nr:glycine--tRNA ligase subunit beta [Desulfobulbaceae bacterium]
MSELLFEIGTEEIPAGYIEPALTFFGQAAEKHFVDLNLQYGNIRTVGTPRRLTLAVDGLQERQPDRIVEHTGPSKQAGLDAQGNPSKAAAGFARSRGVAVEDLKIVETPKGEYLMAVEQVRGVETIELLPDVLAKLVREMPFPKSMRWGDGNISFARPIQWLVALFGGRLVDISIDQVRAGDATLGHRFMAPGPIPVSGFDEYQEKLLQNWVIVDPAERRQAVEDEVRKAVAGSNGAPILDEGLVNTVANLVEVPWGVCGCFDEKFLELPREVLITSMREHQKYFPVADSRGELLPLFVAVNNTRVDDRDLAVSGHQRVLRARLEDGLFFFREDKKRRLVDRRQDLAGIVFQNKLGTMLEKSDRIAALAESIAQRIAPDQKDETVRAAKLAKCDLLTEMVGEFPTLQGVMGKEYARLDGELESVAAAIHEHYKPVRSGGELPEGIIGAIVGMADRLDTLAGCFAIGEKPTGTADPFGLRRQALGLLHIILGHGLHVSLRDMVDDALAGYGGKFQLNPGTADQLVDFLRLRFENDVVASGVRSEIVAAATAVGFDDAVDCRARIEALKNISSLEQFGVLAGSYKRIRNIIKENSHTAMDVKLFREEAEKRLHSTLVEVRTRTEPLLENGCYDEALEIMLEMKEPVDRFFDEVMVMTDDPAVRHNRLNLLTSLGEMVLRVGDISRMHQEG